MCEDGRKSMRCGDTQGNKAQTGRESRKIFLVGIGPGAAGTMTAEALDAVRGSDCLIGAQRMLEAAGSERAEGTPVFCEYRADGILSYLREHPQFRSVAVLLSGDGGFYSGAKKLEDLLAEEADRYEVQRIPGISSIACLAARLGTSWEDGAVVSLHGQEGNFIQTIDRNKKTFLLLGGAGAGERMLRRLTEYGMDHVTVCIGRRLSYPDECIRCGHPGELSKADADGLCVVMVLNPRPNPAAGCHIRDEAFLRGNVPMTKEEVRAVSLAKLELTQDAVVYDIGAGTGSVSVEAAGCRDSIRVYAVEKKAEAVELLKQNRRRFRADGICIVEGEAPGALESLEAPTHVFIGGSSGNLREILSIVLEKNPDVRIVINAISLETLEEAVSAAKEGLLRDVQVTQVAAARSRELGRYHMMTGLNPVFIISAGGKEQPAGEKE